MTSFNSIKLNDNVLTFNGVDYELNAEATITDTNNSSFKGISAVDNGNGTITLTIGVNQITVTKWVSPIPNNAILTSDNTYLVDVNNDYILTTEGV